MVFGIFDGMKNASEKQLWRANECGLLDVRDEPGEPIERGELKEILALAAARGLWQPAARGARGMSRWDSVNS
jgi:hypothetical protein